MSTEVVDQTLLHKILEISQRMAETRDLNPLLNYAMNEAIKLMGAERGYLILLQKDQTLDFRVKLDKQGDVLPDAHDQISRSILDKVIATGQPIVLRNTLNHPDLKAAASVVRLQLRSIICVPLISQGTMIGAVYLENRSKTGQFTRDDLPLLVLFANQAAVAIENAILNDSLEAEVAARTAELKKAMEELEQRWLAAVEINRIRSLLSSTLAHDIRAPLSVAIMTLDQLRYGIFGKLLPDQETAVLSAYQSAHHALKLTNDFFDLVKLELKKLTLYPQRMDTSGYLRTLYEIGQAMPWAEGVKFELALEPDLPQLEFDPTRIQQVIINLLSNALKFTQQGTVTLYAHKAQADDALIIGVRDTGPGLPASELESIFERFQQAGDHKMRRLGSGLGLAICKELIELHQGHIWVESQPNAGADFKFSLPLSAKPL